MHLCAGDSFLGRVQRPGLGDTQRAWWCGGGCRVRLHYRCVDLWGEPTDRHSTRPGKLSGRLLLRRFDSADPHGFGFGFGFKVAMVDASCCGGNCCCYRRTGVASDEGSGWGVPVRLPSHGVSVIQAGRAQASCRMKHSSSKAQCTNCRQIGTTAHVLRVGSRRSAPRGQ
jgi:hypothetical protein